MNLSNLVEDYCTQLRRRQIQGSYRCAKKTAELLRALITKERHPDAASLIEDIRMVGIKVQAAKPVELAIGNIVRRVLHMVREEQQQQQTLEQAERLPSAAAEAAAQGHQPGLLSQAFRGGGSRIFARVISLSNLLDQGPQGLPPQQRAAASDLPPPAPLSSSSSQPPPAAAAVSLPPASSSGGEERGMRSSKKAGQWKHKHSVIEMVNELIEELEGIEQQIAQQAVEHIHANEVIMTFGESSTTCSFLKEAAKKREFQVVVAEAAPRYDGHTMARRLADAGVPTTLISDAGVFAMMARVNKVLVGAHAVLANGGVIAPAGVHLVALAAQRHSIPFVVLVGLHKLSPLFPHDPEVVFNEFQSPADVADFDVLAEAFARSTSGGEPLSLEVHNPAYDYIPPNLVSLFVTDTGGYTPSYVYRLLNEYYSREDYVLSKELLNLMAR